jgi:hypothetical protein
LRVLQHRCLPQAQAVKVLVELALADTDKLAVANKAAELFFRAYWPPIPQYQADWCGGEDPYSLISAVLVCV